MSTNISGEKRQALLSKIAEIKSFIEQNSNDKNASQLISYLGDLTREVNGKKYGLVFEEHREAIDEKLEQNAPVFIEEKDLFIDNGGELNFLLEGDNLASLKLLEKTHRGKIDVIYIDPPYNTLKDEKDDFTYDDVRIDKTDLFAHSKWLSFMKERLTIAYSLLSKKGCIFLSIDDHEFANLKLLMDSIFGEKNFLCDIIWNSTKSVTNTAIISVSHTYNLVYFKDINWIIENRTNFRIPETGEGFSNPDNDPRGLWKADPFQVGGWRPNQQYEIVNPNTGVIYKPNKDCSWKNDYKKFQELLKENRIVFGKNGTGGPQRKRFIWEAEERGRVVKTIWDDVDTTTNGTQELKKIFNGDAPFSNPKPTNFIQRILQLSTNQSSTILDFFAGSGTTGHAVLKLNAEDGGHRKFILCTNNENNICREITYQRLKTVITGTRKDGSKYSDGLLGSLKYFKTDFIPISEKMYYEYADDLLLHVRELVELENAVNFDKDKTVAIVLDDDEMEEFVDTVVSTGSTTTKVVYVGHDVLVSGKQERILKSHKISINTIPDYYYRDLAL